MESDKIPQKQLKNREKQAENMKNLEPQVQNNEISVIIVLTTKGGKQWKIDHLIIDRQ